MKRLLLTLTGVLLVSHPAPVQATILLNEIHLRTPASTDFVANDRNFEFVELKSTTGGAELCTDSSGLLLWILVIENDGSGVGEIKQAWPLRNADLTPLSTGANGLLLLGDDYTDPESPYQFIKALQTTLGDPDGMGADNIDDVNALSFLLVSGYTNPAPLAGTTKPDIDMDNDGTGVFDWADPTPPASRYTSPLWTAIVDSIGFNGDQSTTIKTTYALANLSRTATVKGVPQAGSPTLNFFPHTMARNATDTNANSRAAWYGGTVAGTSSDADSVIYGTNYFNLITGALWKGLVTPGQPNLSSAPVAPSFRINEINLNPPGTPGRSPDASNLSVAAANDGKFEYLEIVNTIPNQSGGSNFSGSLATYALLMVDSGGVTASLGIIREAWNLTKFATGSNGLLVLGDDYPGSYSPFAKLFEPTTQLADPSETLDAAPVPPAPQRYKFSKFSMGDLSNNGVTFLLVQNFTGLVDDDIDSDNDGTMNAVPPFTLIDSVSVPEVTAANELVANHGGYSSAKPDIVVATKHYNADNLSRIKGINDANSTAAWSAGVFGSNNPSALMYRNGFNITGSGTAFRSAASPGKANYSAAAPPAPPASGGFFLNEVNLNPPTSPDNTEYIEVISTTPHALMTNLWLIVLDATPGTSGKVKKVLDLRGQSTGANRLAIFADGIEEDTSALVPFTSARTVRDDPASYNADGTANSTGGFNFTPDSIQPDTGVSILLVAYTPGTPTGVPATPDADLDTNNDGTLDAAPPWTLMDGISTGNGVGVDGAAVLSTPGYSPGNVSRYVRPPGNMTANLASEWFGGELTGGTATSFDYSNNFFGTFKGAASPGRQNVTATPNSAAGLLLNEININPPGGDNNKEFVELRSANNSALSTNNYSVLLIDNDGADTGRVLEVWDLDGGATGSNGLLLAGAGYDTTVPWIGAAAPAGATKLFAPDTMEINDIGLNTDNGALTMVLVKNFKGRVGDDLDEGTQANLTAADDHVFNLPLPWDTQSDSVAMKGYLATTLNGITTYTLEGFIFPGTADLTVPIPPDQATGYTPDTVARFAGSNASNSSAAWYGGDIIENTVSFTEYDPAQYFPSTLNDRKLTPGQTNALALTDNSDTDNDGVPYLIEIALGMNPFVADTAKLPQPSMIMANNVVQPAFTVIRPSLGVAGLTYTVQASFDLQDWSFPTTILFSTTPNLPGSGFETQVHLLHQGFLPLLTTQKRVYYRLKVQRQ